jgi:hypothetical protein
MDPNDVDESEPHEGLNRDVRGWGSPPDTAVYIGQVEATRDTNSVPSVHSDSFVNESVPEDFPADVVKKKKKKKSRRGSDQRRPKKRKDHPEKSVSDASILDPPLAISQMTPAPQESNYLSGTYTNTFVNEPVPDGYPERVLIGHVQNSQQQSTPAPCKFPTLTTSELRELRATKSLVRSVASVKAENDQVILRKAQQFNAKMEKFHIQHMQEMEKRSFALVCSELHEKAVIAKNLSKKSATIYAEEKERHRYALKCVQEFVVSDIF